MLEQRKCLYCGFEADGKQTVCPKCGWKMGWTPKGEKIAAKYHRAAFLFAVMGATMVFWAAFTPVPKGSPPWLHPLLVGGVLSMVIGAFLYKKGKNQ